MLEITNFIEITEKLENSIPKNINKKTKETFPPTKEVLDYSKNERLELSNEKLSSMNNRDFLAISMERRLEKISKNNTKSEQISKWIINELEFSFTFNGKFNRELYLETTAGQVLPKEVSKIEREWIIYKRDNLSWEFFNSWNRRLIIREGTKISIKTLRTEKEIKEIKNNNNQKVNDFLDNNSDKQKYSDLISSSVQRWIDPKFAILVFGDKISKTDSNKVTIVLEEVFTEFDRRKWRSNTNIVLSNDWKYPDEFVLSLLKSFLGDNWRQKWISYWIKESRINEIEKQNSRAFSSIDVNNIPGNIKGLLDIIGQDWNWNYNAINWQPNQSEFKFTEFSLRDILNHQRKVRNNWWQSAIGKYQFIYKTLKEMIIRYNIDLDLKFSEAVQDKLAILKLKERGVDRFLDGGFSPNPKENRDLFQLSLSKEWAILPKNHSNESFYKGVWNNKAGISNNTIDAFLDTMRS